MFATWGNMKSAVAVACLLTLACASVPSTCDIETVPDTAVITHIHGVDFAHYPSPLPPSFSGCKHIWIGDRAHAASMKKLSTAYFENGKVHWFATDEPQGATFRCVYRSGALVEPAAALTAQCPLAADLERQ